MTHLIKIDFSEDIKNSLHCKSFGNYLPFFFFFYWLSSLFLSFIRILFFHFVKKSHLSSKSHIFFFRLLFYTAFFLFVLSTFFYLIILLVIIIISRKVNIFLFSIRIFKKKKLFGIKIFLETLMSSRDFLSYIFFFSFDGLLWKEVLHFLVLHFPVVDVLYRSYDNLLGCQSHFEYISSMTYLRVKRKGHMSVPMFSYSNIRQVCSFMKLLLQKGTILDPAFYRTIPTRQSGKCFDLDLFQCKRDGSIWAENEMTKLNRGYRKSNLQKGRATWLIGKPLLNRY